MGYYYNNNHIITMTMFMVYDYGLCILIMDYWLLV